MKINNVSIGLERAPEALLVVEYLPFDGTTDLTLQVSQSHGHNKHYYADSGEGPYRIILRVFRHGEYSTGKPRQRGKMVEYSTMHVSL